MRSPLDKSAGMRDNEIMTTETTENVKAGRGTKVHARNAGAVQTLCGQGQGSRGGRTSQLSRTAYPITCEKCLKA